MPEKIKEIIDKYPTLSKKGYNINNNDIILTYEEVQVVLRYLFENMKLNMSTDVELYELDRIAIRSLLHLVAEQTKMVDLLAEYIEFLGMGEKEEIIKRMCDYNNKQSNKRFYFMDENIYFQGVKQPPTKVEIFDVDIDMKTKLVTCRDCDYNYYTIKYDELIVEVEE